MAASKPKNKQDKQERKKEKKKSLSIQKKAGKNNLFLLFDNVRPEIFQLIKNFQEKRLDFAVNQQNIKTSMTEECNRSFQSASAARKSNPCLTSPFRNTVSSEKTYTEN